MTHYEILPTEQLALLPHLQPVRSLGYTLYGGTAIALQLGHRESVDFDFFTDRPMEEDALRHALPVLSSAETTQRDPQTWTMFVRPDGAERSVKISFFGALDFGRVGDPLLTERGELPMASLDDLMGHKLKVLLQRVEAKDYLDIAAMIRAGQSIERGLGAAKAMFPTFPPIEAVRTLTWFEGGDLERIGMEDRMLLASIASSVSSLDSIEIVSRTLGI